MMQPDEARRPGLLHRLDTKPRSVCVLKASRVGDFLCALPALDALRNALPGAELVLITLPLLRPLAERVNFIDRIVMFPGYPGLAEQFFDARRAAAFFVDMQAQRFDLAIQLQGSGVYTNPFVLMLGARRSAGFVRPGTDPGLLDAALPLPEQGHEIDRMAPLRTRRAALCLRPEDRQRASRLLQPMRRPLVGLHVTARDVARHWPMDRFAAVAQGLMQQFDATPVILGEAGDDRAAVLARELGAQAIDLIGRTSLPELAAVIEALDLLVTTDSGPAHIAYAVDTPTVVAFSAEAERYGPPGPPHCVVARHACAAEAEQVLRLAAARLGSNGERARR
jgi:ADP-heptose:LPS heptosyltransferase